MSAGNNGLYIMHIDPFKDILAIPLPTRMEIP
jgi:hypothetical protein